MGNVTQALEKITGRQCFETYRRCLDMERMSLLDYDYCDQEFMSQQGETIRYDGPRDVSAIAADWQNRDPAFKLFLDGSRRTYKIVDMPIGTQDREHESVGVQNDDSRHLQNHNTPLCEISEDKMRGRLYGWTN